MDSPASDASPDKAKLGPSFRKLSTEAVNRTYRRPTHAFQSDSSPSDENSEHESSRHAITNKDRAKEVSDDALRKDEGREPERRRSYNRTDKDHERSSDRHFYRESRRHEDKDHRKRDGRHGDESDRNYARSSRFERSDNLDYKERSKEKEKEHDRYMDRRKDRDSGRDHYHRERDKQAYYDDRWGRRRSPERYGKDEKGKDKSRYKEVNMAEVEGVEKRRQHERETERRKRSEAASSFDCENKERETKFCKVAETNNVEERAGSSLKQATEASDRPAPAIPASMVGSQPVVDVNSAKAAAMKAAEFVNRNIGGGGVGGSLTAEQKKKLLWGNKKNDSAGETVKKWDNLFTDRERQEKFNKLMGVKGNAVPEKKPEVEEGSQHTKRREELDMDLEKQYTAGLRRRDGRTVGLGL